MWTTRSHSEVGVSPAATVYEHGATMRGRSNSVTDGDRLLAASIDELGTIDTFGISRRAGGRPAVEILVPARFGRPVLLTEDLETGRWAWHFPQRLRGSDHRFVLDVPGTVPTRADAAARLLVKVVGFADTDRLADTATGWSIAKWEAVHRRSLPVTFPQVHSPHTVEATDLKPLSGASLLLLHDVFGTTASTFGAMPQPQRIQLDRMYEHRVWGFDHPTLTIGPKANAAVLADLVDGRGVEMQVDILAVGRGGLVAAELAALQPAHLQIDSITFVGAPLGGTLLVSAEHVTAFLDRYTNLLALVPESPVAATLDAVCALATHFADPAASALDGLEAMVTGFEGELPQVSASIAGDSAGSRRASGARRLEDAELDALLGAHHDEVVSLEKATTPRLANDSVVVGVSHRELVMANDSAEMIARFLGVGPARPSALPRIERGRTVGGARTYSRVVPNANRDHMHLSVVHGTIALEAGTVLVGHFLGTGLAGSEAAIDVRTRGRMSLRHFARLYPESLGESEVVPNSVADGGTEFPKRVVIVGLGTPERLTKVGLADTVTAGLLKLALAEAERPVTDDRVRVIDLSTPLIGTGGIAPLPVETSITAIVDGILAANSRLREMQLFGQRVFDRVHFGDLRFIELQEDLAEIASRTVGRIGELVRAGWTEQVEFVSSPQVEVGVGGWPRRLVLDSDPDWQRVVVRQVSEAKPPDRPTITFTLIGRSAATGEERVRPNVAAVAKLLEEVADPETTKSAATLYRLLVPHRLRSELDKADNLHFIVDGAAAAYPWEALISGESRGAGEAAISRRAGFIRQFIDTERTQRRPNLGDRRRALVIGNPPTDGAPLEGAYSEAGRVAERLNQYGFSTELLRWPVGVSGGNAEELSAAPLDASAQILTELSGGSYRILHVAAHGVVTDDNPDRTGIVIGTDSYVTADDVQNLDDVSELVFLNCCHLAAKPVLAANLARAFMQSGSQAVVAAGWPVGDDSAERFADRFYLEMLEGANFGAAVRQARRAAFSGAGDTTWAAYQCYGDPGYRLQRRRPRFAGTSRMVSGAEFLRAIDIVRVRASDVGRRGSEAQAKTRATLLAELSALHDSQLTADGTPGPWLNAVAYAALGDTAFELGGFARAIEWYSESLKPDKALGPVKALEQLGNAQVRHAVALARRGDPYQHLLESSLENLETALRLGSSTERYSLLGGHWKKRAVIAVLSPATSDNDESLTSRDEAAKNATGYYAQAAERSPQSSYPVFNWIQLAYLSTGCNPDPGLERFTHAEKESADDSGSFWQRAAAGDAALTRLVIGEFDNESTNLREQTSRAVEQYSRAFELRSSWRERDSVLEHLRDLIALSEGETAAALGDLLQQLLDAIHELGQDE